MTTLTYNNPWLYNGNVVEIIPEDIQGFVYILTCSVTGKKYIGKKNAWFIKTSIRTITNKKGEKKKKKIKTKVPSDWQDYYGSSSELTEHIKNVGIDNIQRTILYMCKTKSELSYYEAYEQFTSNCLLSQDYFNSWIMVRVRKEHLIKKK